MDHQQVNRSASEYFSPTVMQPRNQVLGPYLSVHSRKGAVGLPIISDLGYHQAMAAGAKKPTVCCRCDIADIERTKTVAVEFQANNASDTDQKKSRCATV